MKSSIIFYSARKTSLCEKALRKCLPELGLNLSSAVFATKRPMLGEALTQAFTDADVVFTVGGLEFEDDRSIRDIISQAAAGSGPSLCRRLKNEGGCDGFLIRAGGQLLVMLPDEPEQISAVMGGTLADYIKSM